MRETNPLSGPQGGVVVQISSMGGFMGFAGNAWYHASKFAVEGFTESLNREVRPEWNSEHYLPQPFGECFQLTVGTSPFDHRRAGWNQNKLCYHELGRIGGPSCVRCA